MKTQLISVLVIVALLLLLPASALAQAYSFEIPREVVHVYWNDDGSVSLDYVIEFKNDPDGHPIDYVDLGLPNANFDESSITADVNGIPVYDISSSGFQGSGVGVAIGLGSQTIPPGGTGSVHVYVGKVGRVLRSDSQDTNYASAVFSPAWFETVHGTSELSVTFHFPPGLKPEEPRWHAAPSGFADTPITGFDEQGRVTYTWEAAGVSMRKEYDFGASFPRALVPAGAVYRPGFLESLGLSADDVIGFTFCCGIVALIVFFAALSIRSSQRRKLQYLPPKIAIEGHGIKRGLTAVEAAILLEQPLDKVLTMILFSVVKKGAATVVSQNPLEIKVSEPLPEGLQPYELQFLNAFKEARAAARRQVLQNMMVDLVKTVSEKMKGFSRRETVDYYRSIVNAAWTQVEAAATPEVKSQKFDENIDWTMLDRDYDERTRRVFQQGPVFVPVWWPRYDPGFPQTPSTMSGAPAPSRGGGGGGVSLPTLPGASFAASMVHGVQNFAGSVIGNVTEFTSGVTKKTNPVPVTTSSGRSWSGGGRSGGGCACACACACAGCACACAGGGR